MVIPNSPPRWLIWRPQNTQTDDMIGFATITSGASAIGAVYPISPLTLIEIATQRIPTIPW